MFSLPTCVSFPVFLKITLPIALLVLCMVTNTVSFLEAAVT